MLIGEYGSTKPFSNVAQDYFRAPTNIWSESCICGSGRMGELYTELRAQQKITGRRGAMAGGASRECARSKFRRH